MKATGNSFSSSLLGNKGKYEREKMTPQSDTVVLSGLQSKLDYAWTHSFMGMRPRVANSLATYALFLFARVWQSRSATTFRRTKNGF